MLNHELVYSRLDEIRESISRLKKLADLSRADFLADNDNFAIAEHHLRRSLEALFDIGRHILSKKGFGRPKDYRSIIVYLGKYQIIPVDFAEKIKGMAGYRNRLVHMYADVSEEEIYEIINGKLIDFEEFCKYIVKYLDR